MDKMVGFIKSYLPVFLLVLPMGMLSSTYFPLEHPVLVALNAGGRRSPLFFLHGDIAGGGFYSRAIHYC